MQIHCIHIIVKLIQSNAFEVSGSQIPSILTQSSFYITHSFEYARANVSVVLWLFAVSVCNISKCKYNKKHLISFLLYSARCWWLPCQEVEPAVRIWRMGKTLHQTRLMAQNISWHSHTAYYNLWTSVNVIRDE